MKQKGQYSRKEDMMIKKKYFPIFLNEVKEGLIKTTYHFMAWIAWNNYIVYNYTNKKGGSWENFVEKCNERLKLGNKTYGSDWTWKDCVKETEAEFIDQFNYPFLGWLQVKNNKEEIKI